MKIRYRCSGTYFFGMACLILGLPVGAVPQLGGVHAKVDRVQMSAWIERSGTRKPLLPGQSLENRDKVLTGAQSRLLIRLADGSTLKLGENAELCLNALDYRDDLVFTGAFELVRGAFRLTSGALPVRRALNVRIATITAGLRSADLWGATSDRGDLLCVLDGQVMAVHAKDEERFLSDPPSCYFAPKDAAARPVDDVDAEQIRQGVLQTELQTEAAYAARSAPLATGARTAYTEADALEIYDQARQAGYRASIQPRRTKGGIIHYTVSVTPAASR